MKTVVEKHPSTGSNSTAKAISDAVAIDGSFELKGVARNLPLKNSWKWLEDELERPTNELSPMPPDLKTYVQTHSADLEKLYQALNAAEPVWESDLNRGLAAPVPKLLEQRAIIYLILLDVLLKTQNGQHKEALNAFKTGWRVSDALHKRPEVIFKLISIVVDNMLLRAITKLKEVPVEWQRHLLQRDYFQDYIEGISTEVWVASNFNYYPMIEELPLSFKDKLQYTLAKPYLRACSTQIAEALSKGVKAILSTDPCELQKEAANNVIFSSLSWWNMPSKTEDVYPKLLLSILAFVRVSLQAERTALILRIKEHVA